MWKCHRRHGPAIRAGRALVTCLLAAVSTFAAWLPARSLLAREIKGKVAEVTGSTAKIATDSAGTVKVGDRVEIFEILPDIQEEAGVATGRVTQSIGGTVTVTLDPTSGAVAPGQHARILTETSEGKTADTLPSGAGDDRSTLKPRVAGTLVLRDDFEGPSTRAVPLFNAASMSFTSSNGEGLLTGASPGVLPAMYPERVKDFIAELELRVPSVTDDSGYGLVFRGAPTLNGLITDYYMLLVKPNRQSVSLACWHDEKWSMVKEYPWKDGLFLPTRANRVRLEVVSAHFRVFLNDTLVGELDDDTLKGPGSFGLCLAAMSARPGAVYFDNLRVAAAGPGSLPQPSPPVVDSPATRGGWAGLSIGPPHASASGGQGPNSIQGVRIEGVWPGDPAQEAGLRRGDVILKIDGAPIATVDDFMGFLADRAPGEQVVFVFLRGTQRRQARLTLVAARRTPS